MRDHLSHFSVMRTSHEEYVCVFVLYVCCLGDEAAQGAGAS